MGIHGNDSDEQERAGSGGKAEGQGRGIFRSRPELRFGPGDVITGQFEVVRVLGEGGMGIVYEVMDRITRQRLALKQVRSRLAQRPRVLEYFIQEVTVARQLRHPNIVAVYDVRQEGPLLFFTMEYLEGETLRARLMRQRRFSLNEAAAILRPLCLALEHAHQFTVHRDVSPENVMIGRNSVKLLDFGIAKVLESTSRSRRGIGKTYYTAPEQLDDSTRVDARADIYPLGVMLFEMLTGRIVKKPVALGFSYPGLSPSVCSVIMRAAAPIERRFPSVAEFRRAMDQCIENEASPSAPTSHAAAGSRRTAGQPLDSGLPEETAASVVDGTPQDNGRRPFAIAVSVIAFLAAAAFLGFAIYTTFFAEEMPAAPLDARPAPVHPAEPRPPVPASDVGVPSSWEATARNGVLSLPRRVEMPFVRIRMGTFHMGHGEERIGDSSPAHEVTISDGFWMGVTEVTQAQWEAVMNSRPWANRPNVLEQADAPAVYVSWHDAKEYVRRLNMLRAGRFRLPTETEWEYACRAGSATAFHFGDDSQGLEEFGWYHKNTRQQQRPHAQPVGQKPPNPWGLLDMHGNVAEWCEDWYHAGYYSMSPRADPTGPAGGTLKVVRGGAWRDFERNCTSYARGKENPSTTSSAIGFRVCRDL